MKISTRGRYAIRVMLDLAEHNTGEYIPLMDIANFRKISGINCSIIKEKWICSFTKRKGWRISACKSSGRIYDQEYFTAYRGIIGTDFMSGG